MKTWVQKDGTAIDVQDMTDTHVQNAHRWARRQLEEGEACESAGYAFAGSLQGEMATYYADQQVEQVSQQVSHLRECVKMLDGELKKRGLSELVV